MKKLLFICLLLVFACNQVPQYRDVKIWQDYPDGYIGPRFDDAAIYCGEYYKRYTKLCYGVQ